ncbi:MAG: CpsD/CapB family tyrosine-protein kinase [Ruminiclostridium sp.]|nr:CpsD/CapB family tyrosine-protein kinase [Ruminiclostridium sp.]
MQGFDPVTRQFILNENTPFIITESYSKIRTNILAALNDSPYKSVVITSQCRDEGKTTTAINLALMFSRLDKRVLLIDADLRRSGVHDMLRLKNHFGLSTVLTRETDIYSGISVDVRKNFHVMPAGPGAASPSDLLAGAETERLVRMMYDYYDFIVIDTPPLCIANDSLLFGGFTGGTALVLRENKTTHSELRDALSTISLSKAKFLGVIKTYCSVKYDKSSDYKSSIDENADLPGDREGDSAYDDM